MAGLVPAIHVSAAPRQRKTRVAGINPAMTSPTTIALPLSPLLFGETSFPSPHDFMIYDEY